MKKSRICWIRILSSVAAVLLFSIFLLTIKVNAASDSSNSLPYVISSHNSLNSVVEYSSYESMMSSALNKIGSHSFTSSIEYDSILFVITDINSSGLVSYSFIFDPYYNNSFTDTQYDNFDVVQNSINLSFSTGYWYRSTYNFSNGSQGSVYRNTGNFYVFGSFNTINTSYGSYTPNYPFLLYGSDDVSVKDLNDNVIIFQNSPASVIVPGQATRPDKQERMDFLHNNRLEHVPEIPTPNSYTWITYNPPSIDTSTIESTLVSILDRMQYNFSYLFDNIGGLFSNFISNIGSYFEYLGELISYGFDVVVNNIIAGIENFYDNMVSLIEPLVATVNNIGSFVAAFYALGLDNSGNFALTQMFTSLFVPSSQQLIQAVIDHDDFDFIGTSKVVLADAPRILSQLYNVTPSPVFHVPSCTFHGVEIGDFDISFSWFAPYKVYSDVIVSTFLIIGWIYWFYLSFGSHLKGSNIIDLSGDDSYHRNNIGF